MLDPLSSEHLTERELTTYNGGSQRVWLVRHLTCPNAKLVSPYLIAPVITSAPTVGRDLLKGPSAQRFPVFC
jgi:hypothetical protein